MSEGENTKELPGTLQTVGVLVLRLRDDNKEVLLVKHTASSRNKEGIYGLPAGTIRLGESPREAAIREFTEETGLITDEGSLSQYPDNYFSAEIERHLPDPEESHMRHASMKVYYCSGYSGELKGTSEAIPEWVPVAKINGLNLMPNVELAIKNFLKSQ